jgi:hypothetical protein
MLMFRRIHGAENRREREVYIVLTVRSILGPNSP